MKKLLARLASEPVAVSAAIVAVGNLLAVFHVWTPTPEQLAAINTVYTTVAALVVRSKVSPEGKGE